MSKRAIWSLVITAMTSSAACGGRALHAGGSTAGGVDVAPSGAGSTWKPQTRCPPGMTPWLPRVLDPEGGDVVSGIVWHGRSLLTAGDQGIRVLSLAGDPPVTLDPDA